MKFTPIAAAVAALAVAPVAAQAQQTTPVAQPAPVARVAAPAAASNIAIGATVYGSDENPIGTVEQVTSDGVVVNTGMHSIPLPSNLFGTGDNGPTLNITKADLDTKFEQQMAAQNAKLEAALVPGAAVATADAQPLGTVKEVNLDNIVLMRETGPLTLPKKYFAVDANGAPMVRATMAQIEAAMSANAPATEG